MIFLAEKMMGIGSENFGVATESACQKRYTRAKVSFPICKLPNWKGDRDEFTFQEVASINLKFILFFCLMIAPVSFLA
jgi:hypothetical protein